MPDAIIAIFFAAILYMLLHYDAYFMIRRRYFI